MSASENQLSRYGAISKNLPELGPSGKVFFVAPATAGYLAGMLSRYPNDEGANPRVFTDLNTAVAACRAGYGDVVLISNGYTGTISSATAMTLATAGVTIIGLGYGSDRPTLTLDTATTSTINITAANITIKNCVFVANFAAIASVFTTTTAKDFALSGCEFRDTSAILNFVNIVTTDTTSNDADGLSITKSRRIGAGATTNTTIVSMLGTNDRVTVEDNYFAHAAVTGGGGMIIATGKIVTNLSYRRNVHNFVGATGLTTGMIIITNGTTNSGVLSDNYDQNLDQTTEILVTASSGFIFFNNWHSGVADKSGYLVPAADA